MQSNCIGPRLPDNSTVSHDPLARPVAHPCPEKNPMPWRLAPHLSLAATAAAAAAVAPTASAVTLGASMAERSGSQDFSPPPPLLPLLGRCSTRVGESQWCEQ